MSTADSAAELRGQRARQRVAVRRAARAALGPGAGPRPCQQPGRDDAADRAAHVSLPRDAVVRRRRSRAARRPRRPRRRSRSGSRARCGRRRRARTGTWRTRTRSRWRRRCTVPAGATSHVPSPPTTTTISVTSASRVAPHSAMITPMNTNGIVLSIRCVQLTCRERRGEDRPHVADVARHDPGGGVEAVVIDRVDRLEEPHQGDDRREQDQPLECLSALVRIAAQLVQRVAAHAYKDGT